jgi:hypothetical protein
LVYWQKFNPDEFEYEFDEDELARISHQVEMIRAVAVENAICGAGG